MNAGRTPLHIEVSYALGRWEWVWATAGLRPMTLVYDTVAAALLLALGIWEADVAYLLALWAVALVALTSYVWVPWLLGVVSGGLRRATTPVRLVIDDTRIAATTERGQFVTEWSAVKAVSEIRGCLAIVQFSGRCRLVPLSAFTPEQFELLRAFLLEEGYTDTRTWWQRLGFGAARE